CAFDLDLKPSIVFGANSMSWEVCKGGKRAGQITFKISSTVKDKKGWFKRFLSKNKRVIVTGLNGAYYAFSAVSDAEACTAAFVAATPVGGLFLCGGALAGSYEATKLLMSIGVFEGSYLP